MCDGINQSEIIHLGNTRVSRLGTNLLTANRDGTDLLTVSWLGADILIESEVERNVYRNY